jgi:dCMP deaminase
MLWFGGYTMSMWDKEGAATDRKQEPYHNFMGRRMREEDARQLKWDQRFMEMCEMIAKWSKDPSSQIGAVAVNDERRILATGYNGFPKGIADTEERLNDREEKYPRIVHAETNALMNALYAGVSLKDATMYVHGLPVCPECAKLIIQAGVRRVVINDLVNSNAHWKDLWITRTSPMFKEAGIVVMILGE